MIIKRFAEVNKGTAEAEIRLRASGLAIQWNQDAQIYHEMHRGRSLKAQGDRSLSANAMLIAIGGDECEQGSRRASRESRRSMDAVRRSLERTRKSLGRRSSDECPKSPESEERLSQVPLRAPQIYYLLVSPLLPPISNLATMFTKLTASRFEKDLLNDSTPVDVAERLSSCGTLAIYGGKDLFTSQKKLRAWSEALSAKPNSRFRFDEVPSAGHFWREEGVEAEMRSKIRRWLEQIRTLSDSDNS